MLLSRYYHVEEEFHLDGKIYKATNEVRNEINGKRKINQIVKTYPLGNFERMPYYPRKFPTGIWRIKKPIWTDDINYWPVKIPTDAFRGVMTWEVKNGKYISLTGKHQTDAFYHMHFAKNSRTTLGCIRLYSESDAREIAEKYEYEMKIGNDCWIEVLVSKK